MSTNHQLHIVILAAGKGSRMHSALPKVLHPVAGQAMLSHVLETATRLSPTKIHVVVGHGKQQVIDAIDNPLINWVEQKEQLGTAHAVQQAMPDIAEDANVLVLYGDVPLISQATLEQLIDAMPNYPLALLTAQLPDPSGYGRIIRDDSDSVIGIVEQKDASPTQRAIDEINTGFLCARAASLNKWLANIDNSNAQAEFYLTDVVSAAHAESSPIAALQPVNESTSTATYAQILGVNSRADLAVVERAYQQQQAQQLMAAGVTIIDPERIDIRGSIQIGADSIVDINCVFIGDCEIGRNVTIAPNCIIANSTIADGTQIHANSVIENAELGSNVNVGPFARLRPGTKLAENVRIGNFVETKNANIAAGSKANHLSYVGDATVGENTNIGAGVITCNYDGANKHQTTIGDNVFVGSDSQLIAPVEISDGATIGAGSTITNKVDRDQLAISRSRQRQIKNWQRPVKQPKK